MQFLNNMVATVKFSIKDSFVITTRRSFGLIGKIHNEDIEPGMILTFPTNELNLQIDSIEDVRSSKGKDLIGLVFKIKREEELIFLNEISKKEFILFGPGRP
jgi:uncharacterized protein (DUF1015 family)